jgi:hypothetical protein
MALYIERVGQQIYCTVAIACPRLTRRRHVVLNRRCGILPAWKGPSRGVQRRRPGSRYHAARAGPARRCLGSGQSGPPTRAAMAELRRVRGQLLRHRSHLGQSSRVVFPCPPRRSGPVLENLISCCFSHHDAVHDLGDGRVPLTWWRECPLGGRAVRGVEYCMAAHYTFEQTPIMASGYRSDS